ncbi:MAG TPA: HEAT repeat domain-containing protein [Myxococcota bacterium]|nr:HEAT repeat domain-containing protein [Myxococcota bacterium]
MALDPTKQKILAMLDDDGADAAVRRAAAVVLGELHVGDRPVVAALCALLASTDGETKLAALRGLRGARSKLAVPVLVGMLDDKDEEVRRAAAAAIGAAGPEVAASLRAELPKASAARRRAIVDVLAWTRGAAGLDALVAIIGGEDEALANHAGVALRARAAELSPAEAAQLRKRLLALLAAEAKKAARAAKGGAGAGAGAVRATPARSGGRSGRARRAARRAVEAAEAEAAAAFTGLSVGLRLLGDLGEAADLRLLLDHAGAAAGRPPEVRAAAIGGLRKPLRASKSAKDRAAAVVLLLGLVAEDDLERVVRPALDLLRDVELGLEQAPALLKLAEGAHPVAREFALARLGAMDNAQVGRVLVKHLASGDQASREAAAASLRRAPSAVPVLLKELLEAPDAEAVRWMAGVLRHHAERLKPAERQALGRAAGDWAKAGDARAVPVAELLGAVDPEGREEALVETARKLAGQGRYEEANQALRPLARDGNLAPDTRFDVALYALKAAPRAVPTKGQSARDPALAEMRRLAQGDFPLVDRLFKSKHLDDQERFYVGFALIESPDAADRDLGGEILSRLVDESPRSAVAKSARNKLKLAGYDE